MLEIVPIPVLRDNYVWLVHDPASLETVAVDPSVAEPVLEAAAARGWRITQVWNTHWHPDHTGGNDAIRAATGCAITGPAEAEKVSKLDRIVAGGGRARIGAFEAEVHDIPAHTAGHIAFHLPEAGVVFTGDTLFAMGCGRLFEGSAAQMHDALQRLAALPPETRVYCGARIYARQRAIRADRRAGQCGAGRADGRGRGLARAGRADLADHDRAGAGDQSVHAGGVGRGAGGAAAKDASRRYRHSSESWNPAFRPA